MAKKKAVKRRNAGCRPSTIEPLEKDILKAIGDGMSKREVALLIGVTPRALRKHIQTRPDFSRRVKQAEQQRIRTLLNTVKAGAVEDWKAARWLLAVASPKRYSNRAVEKTEPPTNVNTRILIQQHADWYGQPPTIDAAAVGGALANSAAAPTANLT